MKDCLEAVIHVWGYIWKCLLVHKPWEILRVWQPLLRTRLSAATIQCCSGKSPVISLWASVSSALRKRIQKLCCAHLLHFLRKFCGYQMCNSEETHGAVEACALTTWIRTRACLKKYRYPPTKKRLRAGVVQAAYTHYTFKSWGKWFTIDIFYLGLWTTI